ncbi:MAG: tetratricopeptide repeat protein [Rhizobiales bacterium]|nr:tetratricopeptide repeat protein [Hyphomicrobiales bacterium]
MLAACETQAASEAVAACSELIQLAKTDDQRMRARLKRVALSSELQTVEEDASEILKQEPGNRTALFSRATLRAVSTGQEEGALKDYAVLIASNARDTEALAGRAWLYSRLGRAAEMGADADALLALDPSDIDGLRYGTEAAMRSKNLVRLKDLAGKAAMTYPGEPFGFTGMAAVKLEAGDHAGAIALSSRAIEISGGEPEAYRLRGLALLATGKPDDASSDFSRALAAAPDRTDILLPRAEAFLAAGNNARALEDAEGALKEAPDTLRAREIRSLALLGRGMTGPALAEAADILAITPGNEAMLILRAEARMANRDFEAAAKEASSAAEKLPNSAKAHALLAARSIAHRNLARRRTRLPRQSRSNLRRWITGARKPAF